MPRPGQKLGSFVLRKPIAESRSLAFKIPACCGHRAAASAFIVGPSHAAAAGDGCSVTLPERSSRMVTFPAESLTQLRSHPGNAPSSGLNCVWMLLNPPSALQAETPSTWT